MILERLLRVVTSMSFLEFPEHKAPAAALPVGAHPLCFSHRGSTEFAFIPDSAAAAPKHSRAERCAWRS
jgi:hypothetical protein